MPSGPLLLIFDLDGTLIDSRRDLADSANAMLASYGAPPMAEDAVVRMVGCGAATLVKRVITAAGVNVPLEEALASFLSIYDRKLVDYTRPYDGVPVLLEDLDRRGVAMSLLTNKPLAQSMKILEQFDLARFFRDCVGGDGPFPRKPAPEAVKFLIGNASADSDNVVLIGDSSVDLQTARNAGVQLCLAGYGFGFADIARDDIRPDDWIVEAPADIARRIDAAHGTMHGSIG